jgi:hypothetical protein
MFQKFQAITNYEALQYFATKRYLNVRQVGYADVVSQFDFEIVYRPGRQNIVADALSRKAENLRTIKAIKEADRTRAIFRPMGIPITPLAAIFVPTSDESVAYIFNLSVHITIIEGKHGFETIE